MSESFVDLTYRGLSLGRRIKLTQVRPKTGYLELAIPMPVGTHLAITTDAGVTFDATVSWVYEQVAGSAGTAGVDRAPGMVVVPAVAADPAASWWQARVTLPDEDRPAPRSLRSRPVTQRPPVQAERIDLGNAGPTIDEAITDEIPAMAPEIQARLAAAAGISPPAPAGDKDIRHTTAMPPVQQEALVELTRSSDGESVLRSGEHVVIDDGRKTTIMAPVADESLDANDESGAGDGEADEAGDDSPAGEGGGTGGDAKTGDDTNASDAGGGDKPISRFFKRRRRRR